MSYIVTTDPESANYISQIIVSHMEKIYGEPESIEDYNIVITDATANVGGNTVSFLRDGAFKQVNIIEKDPDIFRELENTLSVFNNNKIAFLMNIDYIEVIHQLIQDVVFIDAPWGGSYQVKQQAELTLSGYPLSEIVRMLFSHDRLTSPVVFKLPSRYNKQTLAQYSPVWYQVKNMLVCVIEKRQ